MLQSSVYIYMHIPDLGHSVSHIILHFVSAGVTQSRRTLSVIDYRAVCLYSLHCCSSMSFANITGGAQNFMSILIRASQMPSARWKISCGKKGVNYSDTLRTE